MSARQPLRPINKAEAFGFGFERKGSKTSATNRKTVSKPMVLKLKGGAAERARDDDCSERKIVVASDTQLATTWQREKDSNPHIRSQSPLCYLYTIPLGADSIIHAFWRLSRVFFAFSRETGHRRPVRLVTGRAAVGITRRRPCAGRPPCRCAPRRRRGPRGPCGRKRPGRGTEAS